MTSSNWPSHMIPKDTKLLRLVSARYDMASSLEAFSLLRSLEDSRDPLFKHLALSLAVCYGRPFLESQGVGSLRVDYPAFPDFADPQMNLRHYRLIDLRNKFMAHSSDEGSKLLILPPGSTNPETGELVSRHDHNIGKRRFHDIRFFEWLEDVVVELKGRLDQEVRKRLVEVSGTITAPTEMETGYDAFVWSVPPVTIYHGQQTDIPLDSAMRQWTTNFGEAENYARHTEADAPVAIYCAQVSAVLLRERAAAPNWNEVEPLHARFAPAELRNVKRLA